MPVRPAKGLASFVFPEGLMEARQSLPPLLVRNILDYGYQWCINLKAFSDYCHYKR